LERAGPPPGRGGLHDERPGGALQIDLAGIESEKLDAILSVLTAKSTPIRKSAREAENRGMTHQKELVSLIESGAPPADLYAHLSTTLGRSSIISPLKQCGVTIRIPD